MKVNILNKLIIDPETIRSIKMCSDNISRKIRTYYIHFEFKDDSCYNINYGDVCKKDKDARYRILAEIEHDMIIIYDQITKHTENE